MRLRFLAGLLLCSSATCAQHIATSSPPPEHFPHGWFRLISRTQAKQPHWVTPLLTTTGRLDQEFHYDIQRLQSANTITESYGGGKGLEIIPVEHVQINASVPPYLTHSNTAIQDGFGDFQFLIKYRLLAATEEDGNYVLTMFLAGSVPTGTHDNGFNRVILTPSIAYGKGFRSFDIQGTFGVALPTSDVPVTGRAYLLNNTLQYHVLGKLWPELEFNLSSFQGGNNDGRSQLFITPGLLIGRMRLWRRLGFVIGGGFQVAVTSFHTTNHNAIVTVRFPF